MLVQIPIGTVKHCKNVFQWHPEKPIISLTYKQTSNKQVGFLFWLLSANDDADKELKCTGDWHFFNFIPAGYDIPKGTVLVNNFSQVHRDPAVWSDPETFKPERFLDGDGKFATHPGWLPFSAGKRSYVGEVVAKSDMYLSMVALFQRFTFVPDPSCEKLEGNCDKAFLPLQMLPKSFKIIAKPRE